MLEEMRKLRMTKSDRKELLLRKAIEMSETKGYRNITGPQVAYAAGLRSHGLVNSYFGGIDDLRCQVLRSAICDGNIEILLQGLVTRDPIAQAAPVHLKNAAIEKLRNE